MWVSPKKTSRVCASASGASVSVRNATVAASRFVMQLRYERAPESVKPDAEARSFTSATVSSNACYKGREPEADR